MAALKQTGQALKFIKEPNPVYYKLAVESDGFAIELVPEEFITEDLVRIAAKSYAGILQSGIFKKYDKTDMITEELCIYYLQHNKYGLTNVPKELQTEKVCLEAVKRYGGNLSIVDNPTQEMYIHALSENGQYIKYVKDPTPEQCLEAVRQNPWAIEHVKNQTEELCLEALKKNVNVFRHIRRRTRELCLIALKEDARLLDYIQDPTPEMIATAMSANYWNSKLSHYVPKSSQKLIEIMTYNGMALRNLPDSYKHKSVCLAAVMQNGLAIKFVKNVTKEMSMLAVKQNGLALQFVYGYHHSPELSLTAVKQNGLALQFVKNQTMEMIQIAIAQNPDAFLYAKVLQA
jgi:hypothetical protein